MRAGQKRYYNGKNFELFFDGHCRMHGWNIMGAGQSSGFSKGKMFRKKSLMDRIVTGQINGVPIAGFFDLKSHGQKSFSHSLIKRHQVDTMLGPYEMGHSAGYIIWFRLVDKVVFINARELANLRSGQSFGPDSGLILGGIDNFKLEKVFLTGQFITRFAQAESSQGQTAVDHPLRSGAV